MPRALRIEERPDDHDVGLLREHELRGRDQEQAGGHAPPFRHSIGGFDALKLPRKDLVQGLAAEHERHGHGAEIDHHGMTGVHLHAEGVRGDGEADAEQDRPQQQRRELRADHFLESAQRARVHLEERRDRQHRAAREVRGALDGAQIVARDEEDDQGRDASDEHRRHRDDHLTAAEIAPQQRPFPTRAVLANETERGAVQVQLADDHRDVHRGERERVDPVVVRAHVAGEHHLHAERDQRPERRDDERPQRPARQRSRGPGRPQPLEQRLDGAHDRAAVGAFSARRENGHPKSGSRWNRRGRSWPAAPRPPVTRGRAERCRRGRSRMPNGMR